MSLRQINIIGSIDWESFKEFNEQMNMLESSSSTKKINIHLASDGGEVHPALAFSSRIRLSPCDIIITAMGNVASAATLILATGDVRLMAKECWVMVHEDSGGIEEDLSSRTKTLRQDQALDDQWNCLMEQYTGVPVAEWVRLNRATSYFTAEECLELNLIDKVI